MKKILAGLLSILLLSSCATQKFYLGDPNGEVIGKDKQKTMRLFWGWIPIDNKHSFYYPNATGYKVITRYNFGDFLISSLTGGIIIIKTVKFEAVKSNSSTQNITSQSEKITAKPSGDIKKDFTTDACGTLGLRYSYFKDDLFSKYCYNKTRSEIISLLGEPDRESDNKLRYVIKAKRCNGLKKLMIHLNFDENGIAKSYGLTMIGREFME